VTDGVMVTIVVWLMAMVAMIVWLHAIAQLIREFSIIM
jgi:hypothetical protein